METTAMETTKTGNVRTAMRELAIESSVRRLLEDVKAVVGANALMEGAPSPARDRYEQDVVRVLSQMQVDLRLARAAFDADEADTPDDLRDTLREIDLAAHQWLDELVVRRHLAGREAGDRVHEIEHRLVRARGEVRRAGVRLDETVESDLDSMRTIALDAIRQVRAAVADSVNAIVHYVP
jgi:hypothetical protein